VSNTKHGIDMHVVIVICWRG